jgi:hypothetical protein
MALALADPGFRAEIRATLSGWKLIYLSHYLTLPPPEFSTELDGLLQDDSIPFLSIIGFRGSSKSSSGTAALPLYLALEKPDQFPFIVIFAETQSVVAEIISNIRKEIEQNELLRLDYGDQTRGISKQQEWTKTSLILKNGVKIIGLSRGQRIRGRRHRQHRPSIAIIDDPEELEKVGQKEYRDKTERWLRSEVIPAIEETRARLIVMGNILHEDAIMARLKKDPLFTHREYGLFSKDGERWEDCTWKGKYPNQEALQRQERKVGRISWLREYLLKVVAPEGQEVKEEWITYYDAIPTRHENQDTGETVNPIIRTGAGVDLAISKKQTADCTAIVPGVLAREVIFEGHAARLDGPPILYILPKPVNERLSFLETQSAMKHVNATVRAAYGTPVFYIEDVAYQRSALEIAQQLGLVVEPMRSTTDKRSRLRAAATFIQSGQVRFPRKGCEDLLAQILGFGIEEHDDLMDALVDLILGVFAGSDPAEMEEVVDLMSSW